MTLPCCRVRELLRATSQPRPHSPDVTEDAAAPPASEPAAQPTARPETISSPPQQQQQPLPPTASKRSPFAQSAAQSPDPMPTLAAVNTKRAEPARTRSAGSDFTMQQTADRQVGPDSLWMQTTRHRRRVWSRLSGLYHIHTHGSKP